MNETLNDIENQWLNWSNSTTPVSCIGDDDLADRIKEDLSYFSSMGVKEYTLWQKWDEVHRKYPTKSVSTIFGTDDIFMIDSDRERQIDNIERNIWTATHPDDYLKLEPTLVVGESNQYMKNVYTDLRVFIHTMKHDSNIGKNINFVVKDKISEKYLGVITIGGDYLDLSARDSYIGWNRKEKTNGMIKHTAVCSSISPTQPFGFNYVGGKLLSLLCLSNEVRSIWKEKYGDLLVGMTTTSLYGNQKPGGLSQYDNLKYWKKMGFSAGKVTFRPTRSTQHEMRKWIQVNYPRKYFEWYVATRSDGMVYKRDHVNRSYAFVYSKLKIPTNLRETDHGRGIYFAPLYKNSTDFLRGEIKESQLIMENDLSETSLVHLWKHKYARQRINSLVKKNVVSTNNLFYKDLIYMSWEEAKEKYLGDVGR